jgi:hypothetical protein
MNLGECPRRVVDVDKRDNRGVSREHSILTGLYTYVAALRYQPGMYVRWVR